ncbi:MAG: gamma-glutamylcyclotransferase [Deltaproteobacteria bacterium]|nr:gamma-glutamylcyclotransferase [Deltaproteobacteria bacterium]
MKTVLTFAYGSNLDRAQMRERCPDATPVGRAVLRGYRIAFAGASRRWDGAGVATLLPARARTVSGVLYALSEESLAVLDRFEGHPHVYVRCRVCVTDEWGRRRFAQAYCLPPQPEAIPATRYLRKITRAYERLGFSLKALEEALGSAA